MEINEVSMADERLGIKSQQHSLILQKYSSTIDKSRPGQARLNVLNSQEDKEKTVWSQFLNVKKDNSIFTESFLSAKFKDEQPRIDQSDLKLNQKDSVSVFKEQQQVHRLMVASRKNRRLNISPIVNIDNNSFRQYRNEKSQPSETSPLSGS